MPTFPEHYLLSWGGSFVSEPTEIWSNGLRLRHNESIDLSSFPDYDDAEMESLVGQYRTKVQTHVADAASGYSANCRLEYVKFNRIGVDGRQTNQEKTYASYITGGGQLGTGEGKHAVTHTTCITFLTAAARGRASKGRLFIPHSNLSVAAPDYRYANNACTGLAASWRNWIANLDDLNGLDGPTRLVPYVLSSIAPGEARRIERVQVGNFPDYMGSRRNRTTEVRSNSQQLY